MNAPYHAGELAVQERAGVREQASKIGRGIHDAISDPAQAFLREQRVAVVASVDGHGRVWASLLTGAPGFIDVLDAHTVRIHAAPAAGDPLGDNLRAGSDVGIVVIDFATRQRARLNGRAQLMQQGLVVRAHQVYGNCPRYIQTRTIDGSVAAQGTPEAARRGTALSPAQQEWIATADTFFIGTHHPGGGADASHRGGNPGFVHVVSDATLLVPDYAGNTMFNTLGNIAANPRAGLLFIDFERGGTLQMTGTAEIIWDAERARTVPGAERLVQLHIDETLELNGSMPWRWRFGERSPHNPEQ